MNPLNEEKVMKLKEFYGENIIKIKRKSNLDIIIEAFLTPLNVYEMFLLPINYITD